MDVDKEVDEGSGESENEDDIEDESDKRNISDSKSEMEESAPQKCRYRKQNCNRRNATLFFIVSKYLVPNGKVTYYLSRNESSSP